MNITIFILVSLLHGSFKYLDILSSREFSRLGITESNPLFRDRSRKFSEWRAWAAVGVIQAIATLLFAYGPQGDPSGSFHPLHSLIVFALSGVSSAVWYFQNRKLVRRRIKSPTII